MNCTVLGGQGFVGRHLVSYLNARGLEVWVPSREDIEVLNQPLGIVFYCIGLTADFRARPFDTVEAHVSLLSRILRDADFTHLVYLSSTRVYARSHSSREDEALPVLSQDPSDLYNISKLMGESLCLSSGRAGVKVARLSNVIGSDMGNNNFVGELLQEAQTGTVHLKTHPDSCKDYIFIDDVVHLLWSIATEGRENIYNVATGMQTSHSQWLAIIQTAFNCEVFTDYSSALLSFPAIDVERVRSEFGFHPSSAPESFLQVLNRK